MSKPALTGEELRDVRDDAVSRLADQARALGALPVARYMENFIDPIVEKIARDHVTTPEPSKAPAQAPRAEVEGVTRGPAVGTVDFATEQPRLVAQHHPDALRAIRRPVETDRQEANRWMVERIARDPHCAKWKQKLATIGQKPLPEGHKPRNCPACGGSRVCNVRETALHMILDQFAQVYGDPIDAVKAKRARKAQRAHLAKRVVR